MPTHELLILFGLLFNPDHPTDCIIAPVRSTILRLHFINADVVDIADILVSQFAGEGHADDAVLDYTGQLPSRAGVTGLFQPVVDEILQGGGCGDGWDGGYCVVEADCYGHEDGEDGDGGEDGK